LFSTTNSCAVDIRAAVYQLHSELKLPFMYAGNVCILITNLYR